MRIAFTTLGCKVNQYETENLAELFSRDGFEVVEPQDAADVYVVNSCTVTASGDKKTRQLLRRLKKQNPGAIGALTGCFPQAFPDAAEKIPEADVITGSSNRGALLPAVKEALATGRRVIDIQPHERGEKFEHMAVTGLRGRTRAFVKIEDGCERYCSYCIIPKARGRSGPSPWRRSGRSLRPWPGTATGRRCWWASTCPPTARTWACGSSTLFRPPAGWTGLNGCGWEAWSRSF